MDELQKWTVEILWAEDEAILPLPKEVIEKLDLHDGDVLNWIDKGDGTWILTKGQYDSDSGLTESF